MLRLRLGKHSKVDEVVESEVHWGGAALGCSEPLPRPVGAQPLAAWPLCPDPPAPATPVLWPLLLGMPTRLLRPVLL